MNLWNENRTEIKDYNRRVLLAGSGSMREILLSHMPGPLNLEGIVIRGRGRKLVELPRILWWGTTLTMGLFSKVDLCSSNFVYCDLSSTVMKNVVLDSSSMLFSDWTSAKVHECSLESVSISSSSLSDSKFSEVEGSSLGMHNVRSFGQMITGSMLPNMHMLGCNMKSLVVHGSLLTRLAASLSSFTRCVFTDVTMDGSLFRNDNLMDVRFVNCSLEKSEFKDSTFVNVKFENCLTKGMRFTDCRFFSTESGSPPVEVKR